MVRISDEVSFVVADIPGLVKGAHQGVGLGIQFLKHIERTRLFVHMVDISGISGREPLQDYLDLNYEIEMYDQNNKDKEGFFPLSDRPQILVLNKMDTVQPEQLEKFKNEFKKKTGKTPFVISGVTGKNMKELIQEITNRLLAAKEDKS